MPEIIPTAIEKYARAHTTPEKELHAELVKSTYEQTEIPQMQTGHLEGTFLKLLVTAIGAKRILEIGTFTGYSALRMAEGMPQGGELITCDIDEKTTAIAREHWKKSHHGKKISLRLGPALETIKKLKGLFDLVFIDADKENYIHYWNACIPKVRQDGIILVDNVLWGGRVLDPKDPSDKAIADFNEFALNDKRVNLVMLTIRDGVTMAVKK
jgi:caffeoyl-CoA O-methyltransferase